MDKPNDTGTLSSYKRYQLYKDDKLIASIITHDTEGDSKFQEMFSQYYRLNVRSC